MGINGMYFTRYPFGGRFAGCYGGGFGGGFFGGGYFSRPFIPYGSPAFGQNLFFNMNVWGSRLPFDSYSYTPYNFYKNSFNTWLCDTDPYHFQFYNLSGSYPQAVYTERSNMFYDPSISAARSVQQGYEFLGQRTHSRFTDFMNETAGTIAMLKKIIGDDNDHRILCAMTGNDSAQAGYLKAELESYIAEIENLRKQMLEAATLPNANGELDGSRFKDLRDETVAQKVNDLLRDFRNMYERKCCDCGDASHYDRIQELRKAFEKILNGENATVAVDESFVPTAVVDDPDEVVTDPNASVTDPNAGSVTNPNANVTPQTVEQILSEINYVLPADSKDPDLETENNILAETNKVVAEMLTRNDWTQSEGRDDDSQYNWIKRSLPDGRYIQLEKKDDGTIHVLINKDNDNSSPYDVYYKIENGVVTSFGIATENQNMPNHIYNDRRDRKLNALARKVTDWFGVTHPAGSKEEIQEKVMNDFDGLTAKLDGDLSANGVELSLEHDDDFDLTTLKFNDGRIIEFKLMTDGSALIKMNGNSNGNLWCKFDKDGKLKEIIIKQLNGQPGTLVEITQELRTKFENLLKSLKENPTITSARETAQQEHEAQFVKETSAYYNESGGAMYVVPQVVYMADSNSDSRSYKAFVSIPGTRMYCVELNNTTSSTTSPTTGCTYSNSSSSSRLSDGTIARLQRDIDDIVGPGVYKVVASVPEGSQRVPYETPLNKSNQVSCLITFHLVKGELLNAMTSTPDGEIHHITIPTKSYSITDELKTQALRSMSEELLDEGWTNVLFFNQTFDMRCVYQDGRFVENSTISYTDIPKEFGTLAAGDIQ